MKFHIARLSFVSSAQKILQKPEFEGTPIELAEKLLVENIKYTPKKRGFAGLYFGDFIFDTDRKLLAARLGKLKEVRIIKYDEHQKGFRDRKDASYPYVYLLWDRDEQAILIEKDMSIFPDYEVLFRSIENHLNNLLMRYELRVSVIPLTEKMDFWKFIRAYAQGYLYEVNFKLYMPNFFGNTQQSIKELLDAVKEDYNATEFSNQISNTDGRLNIQENDQKINATLEWIMKGGGVWSIKGKKEE